MRFLSFLVGCILMVLAIYLLGKNIIFTTNIYPYFWRGIAADGSVLSLTLGVIGLFSFPGNLKSLGWVLIGLGILLVFVSSRAILNPTSLWEFFLSVVSFVAGYQLLRTGNLRM